MEAWGADMGVECASAWRVTGSEVWITGLVAGRPARKGRCAASEDRNRDSWVEKPTLTLRFQVGVTGKKEESLSSILPGWGELEKFGLGFRVFLT